MDMETVFPARASFSWVTVEERHVKEEYRESLLVITESSC